MEVADKYYIDKKRAWKRNEEESGQKYIWTGRETDGQTVARLGYA